jgi:hypothetical protein
MTILLKHTTVAVGTDAGDGEIAKAEWNEAHTLTMETGKVLGRTTAGAGAVEEVPLLDDDTMAADSATSLATQQSIKAYVDAEVAAALGGLITGTSSFQSFTASGTYTPTAGIIQAKIMAVGPGSDGSDGGTVSNPSDLFGGGSGTYGERIVTPAQIGASQAVTIGAANSGSPTSVGSLISCPGATANDPAGGGSATGADWSCPGEDGHGGAAVTGAGISGGSPVMFGRGGSSTVSDPGNNGKGYGAGGASGENSSSGADRVGGAGTAGFVLIEEFF